MVFFLLTPTILKSVLFKPITIEEEGQRLLDQWHAETVAKIYDEPPVIKIIATRFDPNQLTTQEWINMGFSSAVASRIINFQLAGGQFKKKEDLLKIYGIDESLVRDYMDYMYITKETKWKPEEAVPSKYVKPVEKKVISVQLNSADTTALMTINGIGSYWSKRIVKYRMALGGFVSKEQIREIYGLSPAIAEDVIAVSQLEDEDIVKLNINTDSASFLFKHPYISYKTANGIVRYRKQHGDYKNVSDLKKIVFLPDSIYKKIEPYLTVRNINK